MSKEYLLCDARTRRLFIYTSQVPQYCILRCRMRIWRLYTATWRSSSSNWPVNLILCYLNRTRVRFSHITPWRTLADLSMITRLTSGLNLLTNNCLCHESILPSGNQLFEGTLQVVIWSNFRFYSSSDLLTSVEGLQKMYPMNADRGALWFN